LSLGLRHHGGSGQFSHWLGRDSNQRSISAILKRNLAQLQAGTDAMADIAELLSIMRSLRRPGSGCAWDRQQTYESLVPHTLEEAHEVAELIENQEFDLLPDELGDLLFQVVFYCCIAEEESRFSFADVVTSICTKLRRRHPHIFSSAGANEGHLSWRQIKAQERREKLGAARQLAGVCRTLPALSRANKLQGRAAEVGFDWDDTGAVIKVVAGELEELREVIDADGDPAHIEEELGDLLFSCVNLARHCHIEPERALRFANRKFERRFAHMEAALAAAGRTMSELGMQELDALWVAAKATESKHPPE
jgi:nucleoside triphosphate diphosphatase